MSLSFGNPNWWLIGVGLALLVLAALIAFVRSLRNKPGITANWPDVILKLIELLEKRKFDVIFGLVGILLVLAGVAVNFSDDDKDDKPTDGSPPAAFVVDIG